MLIILTCLIFKETRSTADLFFSSSNYSNNMANFSGKAVKAEAKNCIISEAGVPLRISGLWHLELSPLRHAYLARFDGALSLHIREFANFTNKDGEEVLHPQLRGVFLTQLQTRDLMERVTELYTVTTRNEIIMVGRISYFLL